MTILALFVTAALLSMLGIAIHNAWAFPRLAPTQSAAPAKLVSILIPARNEATVIAATVKSLLAQSMPQFELLLLDDHSDDGTGALAQQAANGDPRFRLLRGATLPGDWSGKNWACHQLAEAATGDVLLFTDADVRWQPTALAAVSTLMAQQQADLLTVWPTQRTESWSERLVVPLMALAILAYLPVWLVQRTPYPSAAAANGQCLAFRRAAYHKIGGHAAVRRSIVEDITLAQRIKAADLHLVMADGAGLIQTRMYYDWPSVRAGFAKNILAGHNNSVAFLLVSTLFHLLLFVGPWLWLILGQPDGEGWPWWPLLLIGLGLTVRGLTAVISRQRLADAVWLPLAVILMTIIAGQALWWQFRHGGPQWKNRVILRA